MKRFTAIIAAILFIINASGGEMLFRPVFPSDDSRIRSIIQLPDGRMAIATLSEIYLIDGSNTTAIPLADSPSAPLPSYDGFHHFYYADSLLWLKTNRELRCLSPDKGLFVPIADSLLSASDLYIDHAERLWKVNGHKLSGADTTIDLGDKTLQDITSEGDSLYLFFSDGSMQCRQLPSGRKISESAPYAPEDSALFSRTSLVIKAPQGFFQLRNGSKAALFFYNTSAKTWKKLLETDFALNTLSLSEAGEAIISCPRGLISIDPSTAATTYHPLLRTRTGSLLATEVSTITHDSSGGLWLGTLNRGLFYHHPDTYRYIFIPTTYKSPESSTFFTENQDGSVLLAENGKIIAINPDGTQTTPCHTGLRPNGEYASGAAFVSISGSLFFRENDGYHIFVPADGLSQAITDKGRHAPLIAGISVNGAPTTPADCRILPHDRNFVAFECVSPTYAFPDSTVYTYRLDGLEDEWHSFKASQSPSHKLTATYTSLPPGNYTFIVKTRGSSDTTFAFRIKPPWWQTAPAYISFALAALILLAAAGWIYISSVRRRMVRRLREERLLERIRDLIAQCRTYEQERQPDTATGPETGLNGADADFIARAVEMVERNLNTPSYSVEQLSRDLCMERTGLYRKLTALLDRSPSLFIRDIRLRCAARLLAEGKLSVAEVADATGFSSSSYMSKCFVETYGCRPSEYAAKAAKST